MSFIAAGQHLLHADPYTAAATVIVIPCGKECSENACHRKQDRDDRHGQGHRVFLRDRSWMTGEETRQMPRRY
ncbi:hypothetical protein [Rhizobium sp. BK379]|jgi:hypothetical protein|uniref:hypothetical protein n=1 Tax=Rhizobium sp. BK379 TaxID=2587059 RepID=UPI00160B1982|nr:hypothetical protein [Rhizobium sp. BK379]MBB3445755.1 hypothetical protein [Rhizobium sp. BK379]